MYRIVNPFDQSVYVYFLEKEKFKTTSYSFRDSIRVDIFDDLSIDFQEFTL